ncbi:MAG: hypothetical protein CL489_17725 [Acidobacteria bacterium]|nr:hypothetical protein [Acidobacteriota bacterium]
MFIERLQVTIFSGGDCELGGESFPITFNKIRSWKYVYSEDEGRRVRTQDISFEINMSQVQNYIANTTIEVGDSIRISIENVEVDERDLVTAEMCRLGWGRSGDMVFQDTMAKQKKIIADLLAEHATIS